MLIAGARWRVLRNVNVRIIWERAAYSRTTEPGGRVPRILREFLYSSDGCPPSSCLHRAPMPTISSLPAFLVLLFRYPLPRPPLSSVSQRKRRRLRDERVLSSRLSILPLKLELTPSSTWHPRFLIRHLVAISCFSSLEFNRLGFSRKGPGGRQLRGGSLSVIETVLFYYCN